MTGTDFCVNKPHMSRSYLNHPVLMVLNGPRIVSIKLLALISVFISEASGGWCCEGSDRQELVHLLNMIY